MMACTVNEITYNYYKEINNRKRNKWQLKK